MVVTLDAVAGAYAARLDDMTAALAYDGVFVALVLGLMPENMVLKACPSGLDPKLGVGCALGDEREACLTSHQLCL